MSNFKRYFLILPILCIVLFSCTSFFASAADYNFVYNISEPIVDNWTGYIIQPRSNYSYSSISCDLYFWVITPISDYPLAFPTVSYYYTGSSTTLTFTPTGSDEIYFVTVYATNSYANGSGTVIVKDSFVIQDDIDRTVTLSRGSYDIFWRPQFKNVVSADGSFPSSGASYTVTWGDDVAIYNEIVEVNNNLIDLISGLDLTNDQLATTYSLLSDYLKKIYSNTDDISATLERIWEDFYYWTWQVDADNARIIELLEALVNGSEEFTESSTLSDKQNEMNNIEDDLLNNEAASDAQNDIKVEINENAMSYIWELITSFLSSNPKVFGLFISILSLGIIALVLNR